jgi:hypothetical protein
MVIDWYRNFTEEISIGQEVYYSVTDSNMIVRNIRVDSNGRPLFTLEPYYAEYGVSGQFVARFEEIKEIF